MKVIHPLLLSLALMGGALPAYATEYTTTSCTEADVAKQWAMVGAGDGLFLDCASVTWTAAVSLTAPANTYLRGRGSTSITGGDDLTVITDSFQSTDPLLSITTDATGTFRMYGFTIQGGTSGGNVKFTGIIAIGGLSKSFRMDHVHVDVQAYSTAVNSVPVRFTGYINGVVDNSIFDTHSTGNAIQIFFRGADAGGFGDGPWADATDLGSSDAIYAEDNVFNSNSYFGFANDCAGGGKFVFRYNTMDRASVQTHATGHAGRDRGCRQWEIYGNDFIDSAQTGNQGGVFGVDAGTGVIWGNAAVNSYQSFSVIGNRRKLGKDSAAGTFGGTYNRDAPPTDWGYCGPAYQTGTVTTNGTTAVSWASGTQFSTGWTANFTMIEIDGVDYKIASVGSATALTLADNALSSGTFTYKVGSFWDGNEDTDTGYPCLDQAGRGAGDALINDFSTVTNQTNGNADWSTQAAWPRQALEPMYEWENTYFTNRWSPDTGSGYTQNVDYYTTDDGGVTVGTSRPGTCTVGQAYWETDEGDWRTAVPTEGIAYMGQGILYKCTAMDTWTLFYEPYAYPHPLRDESEPPATPAGRFMVR